jgi:hypothetical protein
LILKLTDGGNKISIPDNPIIIGVGGEKNGEN